MTTAAPGPAGPEAASDDPAAASAPPERRARKPWPTLATVVGGGFVLWGVAIGTARLADNSLLTHIATGRLLIDGEFPRSDPYSFTAGGEPWVVQSWLVSLAYAWLESWFGGNGIRVLAGLLAGALAGLVWQLTRPAEGLIGRIAVSGLVLGVGGVAWSQRPLLVGLLLLAVTLLVAEQRMPPWVLLPVMWIWVNAHGSFPLGLLVLGTLFVGRRADGERGDVERTALVWALGGTVAGMVGPLGLRALVFPVELLGRQELLSNIIEWQSPDFTATWSRLFLVQVVLAVLLLVRRPSYRAAIPMVVFVAAALLGSRNIAVASIVLVPGMARGWQGLGRLTGDEAGAVARVGLAAVVLVTGVMVVGRLGEEPWDDEPYPVAALSWLDQQGALVPENRIAGREVVGNYLELARGGAQPVFFDDRVDMYPAAVVEDSLTLARGAPGWEQVLDRWEIDTLVWETGQPLAQLIAADPAWRIGYRDATWLVACRRDAGWC